MPSQPLRRPPACAPACAPPAAAPAGLLRPETSTRNRRSTAPDETAAPLRPDRESVSTPSAHSPPRRSAWHTTRPTCRVLIPRKNASRIQHGHVCRTSLKRFQSARQKAFSPRPRHPQPERAQPIHEIPLVVPIAIRLPMALPPFIDFPHGVAVPPALRIRFQQPLPGQLRLAVHITPETFSHLRQKMLVMLGDCDYLPHRV